MRSSIASSRASHAPGSQPPPPPSAAALARRVDKLKEYDAVGALERASELFIRRLEGLADDCESMAKASIVFGQVLAQWPQMFRILNLFVEARATIPDVATEGDGAGAGTDTDVHPRGRLVRVPIDELQQTDVK